MDLVIQTIASFGPIALALMGVAMSVWPPNSKKGKARWIWAAAFVVFGGLSWWSVFIELHGTDATLDKIWGKVGAPVGPRLESAGIKTKDDQNGFVPTLQFSNTRDIDAVWYYIFASMSVDEDSPDFDQKFAALKQGMQTHIRSIQQVNSGTSISRGMGVGLQLPEVAGASIAAVKAGTHPMYIYALATYVGAETPKNHVWVTELCAKVPNPFDGNFEPCPTHNGYYYSGVDLKEVP